MSNTTETEIKNPSTIYVDLKDIVHSKVNPTPRKDFDQEELQDLMESMRTTGLINPITVRPSDDGKYELVCGERRLRAAKLLKWESISANSFILDDEEARNMQLIENLQRAGVHPLDEAEAFAKIAGTGTEDALRTLSRRIGKPVIYIAHRMKLNELIPEFKKDFRSGAMNLGHALQLCRITKEAQVESTDEIQEYIGNGKGKAYNSVESVKGYIEENVMNNLSSVMFPKDDATLYPKAGACTTCPKRSGANPTLFADVKNSDRCFDNACFDKKNELFIVKHATEIINEHPETVLVRVNGGDGPKEIMELAKKMNAPVLKQYSDFYDFEQRKTKKETQRAFFINGSYAGQIGFIQPHKKAATKVAAATGTAIPLQVEGIKERAERSIEIEEDKSYGEMISALDAFADTKPGKSISKPERVAIIYLLYHIGNLDVFGDNKELKRMFVVDDVSGMHPKNFEKFFDAALKLSDGDLAWLVRKAMLEEFPGPSHRNDIEGWLLRKIAEAYPKDVDLKTIDADIEAFRKKKRDRANERVQELKGTKKPKGKGLKALLPDAPDKTHLADLAETLQDDTVKFKSRGRSKDKVLKKVIAKVLKTGKKKKSKTK